VFIHSSTQQQQQQQQQQHSQRPCSELLPHHRAADFFEAADNVDGDLTLLAIVGIKDPVRISNV
jgi:hypothetical protein